MDGMAKKAVIFGAAERGRMAKNLLDGKYHTVAYIDNDIDKQGATYDGLDVLSPEALNDMGGCDVIIAVRHPYPIMEQLRKMDLQNPVYAFDARACAGEAYSLYRVEGDNICVPEYMDRRYTVNEELRCHYSRLPEDTLRLFRTAMDWAAEVLPPNGHITELGCGSGQFANMLFDQGYTNYTGYDFSAAAIKRAAELNPANAASFVCGDIRNASLGEGETIACLEVLEHVVDDLEIIKMLPQGSAFIFSVPNFDSFTHVRKFNDLGEVITRYGPYVEFERCQKVETSYDKCCWFLVQGRIR